MVFIQFPNFIDSYIVREKAILTNKDYLALKRGEDPALRQNVPKLNQLQNIQRVQVKDTYAQRKQSQPEPNVKPLPKETRKLSYQIEGAPEKVGNNRIISLI